MEEKWKEIYEAKRNSRTHVKGDKYYVSNYGRVKYNDIILDMGKGLYVSNSELRIYGCPLKDKLYRIIYKLFVGNLLHWPYQIHHKDFNHLNNAVDNLIQVTPREHGNLHSSEYSIEKTLEYKEIINDLSNNESLKEQSKLFFEKYTKQRLDIIKEKKEKEKQELKEQKKQQREQQKKQYIEYKLNKGFKISIKGVPYDPERLKNMYKSNTKDSYKKMAKTIKQKYKDDPSYKERVCKNRGMICINDGLKIKYIDSNELDKYIADGWVRGRKLKH